MSEIDRTETATETGLSPGQEKVLIALLASGSIRQASKAAEVGEATVYRYLNEPAFKQAYKIARREALEVAIRKLENITGQAVDTLSEVMTGKDSTPSQKCYAAKTILEFAFNRLQDSDILDRIENLEDRQRGKTDINLLSENEKRTVVEIWRKAQGQGGSNEQQAEQS